MVPPGRVELPLPKEEDFESTASTNSATGALYKESSEKGLLQRFLQSFIFVFYTLFLHVTPINRGVGTGALYQHKLKSL